MKKTSSLSKIHASKDSTTKKKPVKQHVKRKQLQQGSPAHSYFKKNKTTEFHHNQPDKTRFILFNKPFQVLSQFSPLDHKKTLSDWINIPDVYPAGRLDYDSEGLLILTNNGRLQYRIAHPAQKLVKTYAVQVEGKPTYEQLQTLREGVRLKDGVTKPAEVMISDNQSPFPERVPPIRQRKNLTETWIEISITEGKNRQIRRMTAAVGLPTLRLVRTKIGQFELGQLQPGEFMEIMPPKL